MDNIFLQQVINGLILGSVYATIALGYTMVYGILNLINFAHGDVLMIGALSALAVVNLTLGLAPDLPGWLVLIIGIAAAVPICVVINLSIERFAYRPLRNKPRLTPLITAIGMSLLLQAFAMLFFGRNFHVFPQLLPQEPIAFAGVTITVTQILILVTSTVMLGGLVILVEKTNIGRAMRATSENPTVAGLMGVNTNRVISLTFAIGAALAAVAGVMYAANYAIAHFFMGFIPGLKAFTAAVLGGIGNIYGAMLGGILLGLIEAFGAGYIGDLTGGFLGSHYQDIFAFVVLIGVLTLRPTGLLGERIGDRA